MTTRELSTASMYNSKMTYVRVPREFSRRVRRLDFSVLKGQEYRNIALFYFPIVLECIPQPHKERQLWLEMCYSIRACIIPEQEYEIVNPMTI